MTSIRKALIVGAGIGGLTAAVALRRAGVTVDVVDDKVGRTVYHVGIIIQANAVWALESIGLADDVIQAGAVLNGLCLREGTTGQVLHELPRMMIPGKEALPDLGITRPALHDVLQVAAERAGARLCFGVTHAELAQQSDGVAVQFTDGTQDRYDLVIGCDGAYSSMRRMIWGDRYCNRYTGQATWRYNLPRLPGLDKAEIFENVPGRRAGLIPLSATEMYVLLVSEEPGNPRLPTEALAPLFRERLQAYGGDIARVREAITDSAQVVYRPLEGVFVDQPWYDGRVLLIGDAVHTPTPHLAQGAGMAIEDGVVLGRLIGEGHDVAETLQRFHARRFERCKRIWSASVQVGEWEMRPSAQANPAQLMARMQEEVFFQPI
jgi:2-polyprenyl-6-methoxyphenol hydroxylase-like FAD-dependent oxidoreductase